MRFPARLIDPAIALLIRPAVLLPGLVSITFRTLSPREVVALAARCGLRGVEWGGDVHAPHGDVTAARVARQLCGDHGLRVSAYGSYYRLGVPATAAAPAQPSFDAVVDSAAAMGAPVVRVWAGVVGSNDADQRTWDAVVTDGQRVADRAARAGLTVALEFHANTLTDTPASAVRLLRAIDRPAMRTYWQPPNGAAVGQALDGLRAVRPWLSHVHVFHWWPAAADRRPLADGVDRWRRYLSTAAAAGHDERFAMLEFVRADAPENLAADAAALVGVLDEVHGLRPATAARAVDR